MSQDVVDLVSYNLGTILVGLVDNFVHLLIRETYHNAMFEVVIMKGSDK